MQYAAARLHERAEAAAFRTYLADTLYFVARNQAIDTRWGDFIHPKPEPEPADPDEIKGRILNGLKGL